MVPRARTFVVDDHPVFLRTVAAVLAASEHFELVGTAATGDEAYRSLQHRTDVDLVLLDVHLPDESGIDVARRLEGSGHRASVVLMSTSSLDELADGAGGPGVAGFLPKELLSTTRLHELWCTIVGTA